MTKTAYLTGYTGRPTRTPEQLRQLAINLGAVVVDCRYSPQSRVPHWNKEPLRMAVGSNHYFWVQSFGNPIFRTGKITLRNPDAGLINLLSIPADNFIILCACADGETCHRKQVGEYLAAHGWKVRDVTKEEGEAAR
jgi:uncharacterized protein (DUF488 family)